MSLNKKERNLSCIRDRVGGIDVSERDFIRECAVMDDVALDFASFAGPSYLLLEGIFS